MGRQRPGELDPGMTPAEVGRAHSWESFLGACPERGPGLCPCGLQSSVCRAVNPRTGTEDWGEENGGDGFRQDHPAAQFPSAPGPQEYVVQARPLQEVATLPKCPARLPWRLLKWPIVSATALKPRPPDSDATQPSLEAPRSQGPRGHPGPSCKIAHLRAPVCLETGFICQVLFFCGC